MSEAEAGKKKGVVERSDYLVALPLRQPESRPYGRDNRGPRDRSEYVVEKVCVLLLLLRSHAQIVSRKSGERKSAGQPGLGRSNQIGATRRVSFRSRHMSETATRRGRRGQ